MTKKGASAIDRAEPERVVGSTRKSVEIELKLSADPVVLSKLWDGQSFADRTIESRSRGKFENTYYDTAKNQLRRRRISFRVREAEGRYEQTVKLSERAGKAIQNRQEWNWDLPDAQPSLEPVADAALRDRLGPFRPGDLRPVFRTIYHRDTKRLVFEDAGGGTVSVEAALDIGEIRAGKRTLPIAEIELELIEGSPSAIFDFALSLFDQVPIRVETMSKSARGYALAAGRPPVRKGGWVAELPPNLSLDDAIEAIFSHCFDHWLTNEAAAVEGSNVEGVHQVRVAIRRMRSMLTVFRKALPPDHVLWLSRELKWLSARLGPARDWDVFLTDILPPVLEAQGCDERLIRLKAAAEDARHQAYEQWRQSVQSRDYAGLVLTLATWLSRRGWSHGLGGKGQRLCAAPAKTFARDHLNRRRKRLLKRARQFMKLTDDELHRLRLDFKRLRCSVEFFAALLPRQKYRRWRKLLTSLQDQLGYLNDIATLQLLSEALCADLHDERQRRDMAAAFELIIAWHRARRTDFRARAAADWDAFVSDAPF